MPMWPHIVERLIREAEERGDFENLPGLGKPIPDLDQPYDEMWWVRKWIQREGLQPMKELREEGGCPAIAALLAGLDERRARRSS